MPGDLAQDEGVGPNERMEARDGLEAFVRLDQATSATTPCRLPSACEWQPS